MSERTTSVPAQQPHPTTPEAGNPTPEPATPATTPEPGTAEHTAEQASRAAELAAEQEARARDEAATTLKAVVRAYRQGEQAYRAGLL